ncbi:myb/SANT-like DNA-binding domain-containing protein 4 isoform X2 [Cydia pomonella]|uniref:myb/SANT-like DNA-binding domain-containing protein 4 isoform X2 n=1 Tax=Cydia pomonella TaxID=82600 RepID=UPI002ADD6EE0|nr:myb/SANT-like DNA-binding domain-containing protein 4 isoform X2 [Cydia pomonella]
MSRVNQAQMKKLLDLLSEDGVLVNGKVSYSSTNKQSFWKQIALQLNSVDGGVYKNTWKWCKMWADWKNKTKKKANILLRKKHYNYSQQVAPLNNLELRLLKMIDYPLDNKADVTDLEMVNKVEMPEPTPDELTDFLTEGYEAPLSPDRNMSSDEEDNTVLGNFARSKNKFCNVDNSILEGKKYKKLKTSLEEFKLKSTLALEKEKVQQKSEELRLRALELKLKGEELRLQEIEMNKINYLTNIEEEKLKCFKDISASLKELLDRTRNGNVRFHNVL